MLGEAPRQEGALAGEGAPESRRRDPQAEPALGIAPSQARFRSIINGWILHCASAAPENRPACLRVPPFFLARAWHGWKRGPFHRLVVPSCPLPAAKV